jgi:Flp pilus assembly secretin CpaC
VAGLAGIPALGALFRQNSTSVDESEVLLVIRPRLLSIAPHDEPGREFATGSEARPRIPL